jgi:hypothetical protein
MAINGRWWATVNTGGSGSFSGSVSWRFPGPLNITAHAAIGAVVTPGPEHHAEIGFSGYVQDGAYHPIGGGFPGTWVYVFFRNRVTQLDLSARSRNAWASGSAIAYSWDEGVE